MATKSATTQSLRRRNVLSFSIFIVAIVTGVSLFLYTRNLPKEEGLPWVFRRVFQFNTVIGQKFLNPEKVATSPDFPPKGKKARVNGLVGLKSPIDLATWQMKVETLSESQGLQEKTYTMADLEKLPFVEIATEFKCVEGWSENMSFGGVRFSEFLKRMGHGTKSGQEADLKNRPDDLYRYVGFETPDGAYYVSLDIESLMNPHALLAYQQNGIPLSNDHGAPLRLYVPNKYGVKSLKRIGRVIFSDRPFKDYWAEKGYDRFLGL